MYLLVDAAGCPNRLPVLVPAPKRPVAAVFVAVAPNKPVLGCWVEPNVPNPGCVLVLPNKPPLVPEA